MPLIFVKRNMWPLVTRTHVVEPRCPGAVERYINLGDCYDAGALRPMREELIGCMAGYQACYQRAYRCLGAAAEIFEDQRAILLTPQLVQKLSRRARGILRREVPRRKEAEPGQVTQRFLGAVTHRGKLCLYDSALIQCGRVYELADGCDLAHELLLPVLTGATALGWDVIACPNPMAPQRLAHLLLPGLGLAFLSTSRDLPLPVKPFRRVRLDAAADGELLRRNRPRLRFARKVSAALEEEAVASLAQAKAMHDALERLYNPHVNFDRVEELAQGVWEDIQSLER